MVRPKKIYVCVSRFCPDPKHFIVNCEQNVVKFTGNSEKYIEKCNFYIKYFDKKCYADRPYLKLKPETHIYIVFGLRHFPQHFWVHVMGNIPKIQKSQFNLVKKSTLIANRKALMI